MQLVDAIGIRHREGSDRVALRIQDRKGYGVQTPHPGWWEVSATVGTYVNLEKWASLPKQYQFILQGAAAETNQWMTAKYDAANPAALKRLVANGAVLKAFTPDVMDGCWKAANEVYAELSEKNAWFKRTYDHFVAFRSDQYLCNQVADYTMDSYMIRYRNQKT